MQYIPIKALCEAEFYWYIQECWCAGSCLLSHCRPLNLKRSIAHTDLLLLRIILSQTLLHKIGHFLDWHLLKFLPKLKSNSVEVK